MSKDKKPVIPPSPKPSSTGQKLPAERSSNKWDIVDTSGGNIKKGHDYSSSTNDIKKKD